MSQSSNFILTVLRMVRFKEQARRQFQDPPRGTGTLDPRKTKRPFQAQSWSLDGFKSLTISGNSPSLHQIIYLPGGAYRLEATSFHRKFAEKLVRLTGMPITIVDYPKSPEYTFQTTHDLIQKVYQQLRERYPGTDFCLLGDSAGGGLALAFLQSLRDQGADHLPQKTVLISPWLDLSLSHPDLPSYETRDPILPLDGLQEAARLYSGGKDLRLPLLSPLFGDLNDLGKIKLVFGSEEVFYPDCLDLIQKIDQIPGTEIDWTVGENQIHAWPIFPFPESRATLNEIARFLLAA